MAEARHLRVGDIDSKRMLLHVRCTKNRYDRVVPLSSLLLATLREYYRAAKLKGELLFAGRKGDVPITGNAINKALLKALDSAGLNRRLHPHLFRHAFATHLLEMGEDLHTWSRQLVLHPHVHAIVSAGGLTDDGAWKACREDYLFPVYVMKRLFRRLFRDGLLSAVADVTITMAPDLSAYVRSALFEKKWVVYAKAPFGGAQQVFAYLGRYTHRIGLSNARIQHVNEHSVTFATKYGRSCTLEPVEFLRRFLLHVLPKGFHKIRHYGLCSGTHVARGTLEVARRQLMPSAELEPCTRSQDARDDTPTLLDTRQAQAPETWAELLLTLTGLDVRACPNCAHGRMRVVPVPLAIVHSPAFEDTS